MRHVDLEATVRGADAAAVLAELVRFDRYPDLAPHVRATEVHQTLPSGTGSSSWELHFRSGLLRWTEAEVFDLDALTVAFTQDDGDFDTFAGTWTFTQDGADVTVAFAADFDFGIPSMAGILDPIAERVIRETVAWAIDGSFPEVSFAGDLLLQPAAAATPGQ
ncbi:type II toxin-antitoxin system RatA family toxin [Actinokineospora iranica]|uniref:Polyketide cyclase / dehydrase and lipid transport n=1 Tax=Actinokineospora iranica TaxID=1271860 RepID=A0A1G6SM38_9PSEU|nr:SRPBCC family protein [Actinokineospora iranica]SDD17908.1 Polyketide cyclase / dehydrase and lipid transport [Actinokineospora iranica]